jgi:endonuclease YncB( thermonuclease family)
VNAQHEYAAVLPVELRHNAFLPPTVPAPIQLNAIVVEVHDGDTFTAEADMSWLYGDRYVKVGVDVRILGMNAREIKPVQPGGPEAQANLSTLILGKPVVLTAMKPDKYGGRIDAVVTYIGPAGVGSDLASDLIADHWAAVWNGKGPKPLPPWPRP